jgi:hypothetical protein
MYNASDRSLIHSSPYRIAVSMVVVPLGGVFADAWEDNHTIQCLYMGATFPVWLSAQPHLSRRRHPSKLAERPALVPRVTLS